MSLKGFGKRSRVLVLAAGAIVAVTALTACSGGATEAPAGSEKSSTAAAMPETGNYIAEIPGQDGATITMGLAVEGDQVAAYATNGTNDAAWLFGTQQDGSMELISPYQDDLKASFDGTDVTGDVTINEVSYKFAAEPVAAPAGMYTATRGDERASFVVRPDGTMVGMRMPNSNRDREVIDQINEDQQDFKDKVRQMRLDRQMQPAQMTVGTWQMEMGGTTVTAVPVTGGMRF